MKKGNLKYLFIALGILFVFVIPFSYAIYRNSVEATGSISLASWSVSLNQTGVNDNLVVIQKLLIH